MKRTDKIPESRNVPKMTVRFYLTVIFTLVLAVAFIVIANDMLFGGWT